MKKTAIKKTTEKSVKVKSKLSENQQDFNKAVEATGELKKNLKQFKSSMIAFESYLKPYLTDDSNLSLDNLMSDLSSVETMEQHTETDDANHTCEMCSPTSIQSIYLSLKFTIVTMIDDIEEVNIETGKKFKDTQQFITKHPEKERDAFRKIINIEIRNEGIEKMRLQMLKKMIKLEKQADKLIIKQNKEELKKGKGKKIIKLVN